MCPTSFNMYGMKLNKGQFSSVWNLQRKINEKNSEIANEKKE